MRCDDSEFILVPRGRGTGGAREIFDALVGWVGDGGRTWRKDLRLNELVSDGGELGGDLLRFTGFGFWSVLGLDAWVCCEDLDQGNIEGFLEGTGGGEGDGASEREYRGSVGSERVERL